MIDAYMPRIMRECETGHWSAFADWFADDAEMRFEGVPVGPFHGRDEIRAAYERQPPDDEFEIRNVREQDGRTVADYGWRREGGVRAGELRIVWAGVRIASS